MILGALLAVADAGRFLVPAVLRDFPQAYEARPPPCALGRIGRIVPPPDTAPPLFKMPAFALAVGVSAGLLAAVQGRATADKAAGPPPPWTQYATEQGDIYFYNPESGESVWA